CWECNSKLDPKCSDPFDNRSVPLFDCQPKEINGKLWEARLCRKIRQKINGEWRTIRGCAYLGEPGEGTGNENHCLIVEGIYSAILTI
ncbi:hypothetical protein B4U79_03726, partial [Dinothrombium tinctorium]